jgi:hypothetical protein
MVPFVLLAAACGEKAVPIEKNEFASRLVGTWVLKARIVDGTETPATERQMKLILKGDQTFVAKFRGDATQTWINAGQGSFSYDPPLLNLYWDSGPQLTLLATENGSEELVIHHGRNLVPLNNQEPTERFVREKSQSGPTRQPS